MKPAPCAVGYARPEFNLIDLGAALDEAEAALDRMVSRFMALGMRNEAEHSATLLENVRRLHTPALKNRIAAAREAADPEARK
jgi:hypothetical protein